MAGSQNVTDNDVNVTNTDVATIADTGERVFDASFGAKNTYRLYNYTADPRESTYTNYTAVIRTSKIRGFAFNAVISNCTSFMRYVPYVLKHIDEPMYNQGKTLTLNVTGANYLYIVSYPTYSGFKIVNDPTYTMYYAPSVASTTASTTATSWLPITVGVVIAIAMIAVAVSLLTKRRMTQP
jgi:heme/copper-type cytochrome/quinol oxidase subunit 2